MPKLIKLFKHVVWKVTPGSRRIFPSLCRLKLVWSMLNAIRHKTRVLQVTRYRLLPLLGPLVEVVPSMAICLVSDQS